MTHRLSLIAGLSAVLIAAGCQAQAPVPGQFALEQASSAPAQHLLADTRTSFSTNVTTFAGTGQAGFMEGPAAMAKFNAPHGLAMDPLGNLYVADTFNMGIRAISPTGMVLTFGFPMSLGKLILPRAVAVMPNGSLAVLENQKNRIQFIDATGNVTPFVGGSTFSQGTGLAAEGTYGYGDGRGPGARFQSMYDFCVDGAGNMYISDRNRVRKALPDGTVVTLAGIEKVGHVDGPGYQARFNTVKGIAVDAAGIVYVVDSGNHRIRRLIPNSQDPNQVTVQDVAGSEQGYRDASEGRNAFFFKPTDVALDSIGNLYVTDTGNHRIRKILTTGEVITLAGNGADGTADGTGDLAQFSAPDQLTVDGAGNVYVTDAKAHAIRMIQQL